MTVSDGASIQLHGSLSVALISDVCVPVVEPLDSRRGTTEWATNVPNDAVFGRRQCRQDRQYLLALRGPLRIINNRIIDCCSGQSPIAIGDTAHSPLLGLISN